MGTQNGYIEVELDGKTRLLRFDFNAIADVEEYFGKGIAAIMDDERVGFSTVRALYWGGMKWKIKGLTIQQTGMMIQKELETGEKSIGDLMKYVAKAMQSGGFMGKKRDEPELIDAEYEEINEDGDEDEKK